jgi:hypothetical protein
LLAETRKFRHAETAETAKTRFRQVAKNTEIPKYRNTETAETAETVSAVLASYII